MTGTDDRLRLENALRRRRRDELLAAIARQSCTQNWNPNTGQHCGRAAAVHILCPDGHAVMICAFHMPKWVTQPRQDHHPIGGECGLPDAAWVMTRHNQHGRCIVEGLDFPDLFPDDPATARR